MIIISVSWIVLSSHNSVLFIHSFTVFCEEHYDFRACCAVEEFEKTFIAAWSEDPWFCLTMNSPSPPDELLLILLVPLPISPQLWSPFWYHQKIWLFPHRRLQGYPAHSSTLVLIPTRFSFLWFQGLATGLEHGWCWQMLNEWMNVAISDCVWGG